MIKCVDAKITDKFALYQGDSCEVLPQLPSESIHYMLMSPPFSSLYVYSNSERDLGNCQTVEEFLEHYKFITSELYRLLKPGRLLSFHCMLLPTSKERDGFIGLTDFRGQLIKAHQDAGFIFHSEVVIWKDPVTAMQRTKALGLLHKQILKDSCMSRQGIPDYVVTMRKAGVNAPGDAVSGPFEEWIGDDQGAPCASEYDGNPVRKSIAIWQRYASPVWMDINPSKTLQKESAREHDDERHIAPLQLQVIQRCLELWTNPGDVVLSPFAGIGSEGYVTLQQGRKFIGIELKESYYRQAALNLTAASSNIQGNLFEAQAPPEGLPCPPDDFSGDFGPDGDGTSPGFFKSAEELKKEYACQHNQMTSAPSVDTSDTSTPVEDALPVQVEAQAPPETASVLLNQSKKRGRPKKVKAQAPPDMKVLSETGIAIVQESFFGDDVPDWVK